MVIQSWRVVPVDCFQRRLHSATLSRGYVIEATRGRTKCGEVARRCGWPLDGHRPKGCTRDAWAGLSLCHERCLNRAISGRFRLQGRIIPFDEIGTAARIDDRERSRGLEGIVAYLEIAQETPWAIRMLLKIGGGHTKWKDVHRNFLLVRT